MNSLLDNMRQARYWAWKCRQHPSNKFYKARLNYYNGLIEPDTFINGKPVYKGISWQDRKDYSYGKY